MGNMLNGFMGPFMGKGLPSNQVLNFLTGVYKKLIEKEINNFEDFHRAVLDIFSSVNAALPGIHYEVPARSKIEACFEEWKKAKEEEKKKIFLDFITTNVEIGKLDDTTLVIGLVTPPAAMVAKRAGERVPQFGMIKAIPDVIFVPTATVLALGFAKLSRKILQGDLAS